ncbi:ESPR-type extended signal peptide-containing protein [Pseudomonas sp. T8]|uniref:ESPR-type extended signal peptide-containing protein n=1 Tax=Pseudomonas sp. T8 TaxID=645292 RepID=UPI0027D338A1|nr:ESPR-type extended signal peptide-containing protein [Pseudomonas sp. T8]
MNKFFSVVWSFSLRCWVVASEFAASNKKKSTTKSSTNPAGKKTGSGLAAVGLLGGSVFLIPIGASALIFLAAGCIQTAEASTYPPSTSCAGSGTALIGRVTVSGSFATPVDGSGTWSSVLGCDSSGNGQDAVSVFGSYAQGTGQGAAAFGFYSLAGTWASALGLSSTATGIGSTALGFGAQALSTSSVAIGGAGGNGTTPLTAANSTIATGVGSIAIGSNATRGAQTNATDAIAIGGESTAGATSAIAIGHGSSATGTYGVAAGDGASAAANAIAVGRGAKATGAASISIGLGNTVSGNNSGAIGDPSTVSGANSYSLGNNNTIVSNNAFALGNNITIPTGLDGSVVLGNNSTIAASTPTASATINGTTYNFAGATPVAGGVLSVGTAGSERQVTNVAAGRVTGTSTDAVNGSQLFATNTAVNGVGTTLNNIVNNGAGIKYFHTNSTLADSTATGTNSVAVGPTASATATNAVALGNGATAGTANSVALGSGAITVAANATTGGTINGTAYTYSGGVPIGVLSLGTAGNERQITNVAAGQVTGTSTDAVNGSQLFATNTAVNGVGTTLNNIVNNGAGIKYFHSNSTLADSSATGSDSVAVGPVASASAANSIAVGNGAVASVADSVALGNGATTAAATATPSGVVNGSTYTYAGSAPVGVMSVGAVGSERQISNVAAGRVSATSTDAVNGSQLFATNISMNTLGTQTSTLGNTSASTLGGGATYSPATGLTSFSQPINSVSSTGAVGFSTAQTSVAGALTALNSGVVNTANIAVKYDTLGGNTITLGATGGAGAPAGGVNITNLAAGTLSAASTDAVNGGQLYATNQTVNNIVNNGAGIKYFHANSTLADSTATGTDSVAVGPAASSTATNAVAIGNGAVASVADSVALGNGATTAAATATPSGVVNGSTYTYAGSAPVGVMSIGAVGSERQISNVAAGRVSATSTDAINGSQLFATNTSMNTLGAQTTTLGNTSANTLGGGATYSPATGLTGFSQPINSVSTTGAVGSSTVQTSVAGALTALNSGVVNTANIAVKYDALGGNTITLGATGGAGAPAGGVKITNLTAGTLSAASTDAVNGGQLFATNTAVNGVSNSVNNIVNSGAGIKYFHANSTLADSTATGTDSVAVGPVASSTATNAVAIGNGAVASVADSVALGNGATTAAATATPSGVVNGTTYTYAGSAPVGVLSVGALGKERQISNVAAGQVSATSTDAVNGSQLFATNTAVDGLGTSVNNIVNNGAGIKYFHANSALADSTATGIDSVAVGPAASSTATNAVAIGNGAVASVADSVALGNGATTAAAVANTSGLVNGTTYTYAGGAPVGVLSVGALGKERQVSNVAAGQVSATSTDAVNGSQLFATNISMNNLGTQTTTLGNTSASTLGGGATYSPATGLTGFSQPINSVSSTGVVGPATAQTSVAGALTALNSGVVNTANIAVKYDVLGGNTITLGATGGAGAPAGGVKITNLTAGTLSAASTDAVNGGQLFATNTAVNGVSNSVNNIVNNGAGIKYFHANSTLADSSATGTDSVAVGPTASSTATNAVAIGNGAVASVADSVALGNGATTAATTATPSGVVNGSTYTYAGSAPVGVMSVGAVGSERQISNVAAGQVSATSTDAVNGSQLFATNISMNTLGTQTSTLGNTSASTLGGGATYSPATGLTGFSQPINSVSSTGAVGFTTAQTSVAGALTALNSGVVNTANIAVKYDALGGNTITLGAIGGAGAPAGGVNITNLAAGTLSAASTDAVNGGQLYATNQTVNNIVNNGAGIKYFHANSTLADSTATGTDSVAVGPAASSMATNAVAIGNGAVASVANSVALGANSITAVGAESSYTAYRLAAVQSSVGEVGVGTALGQRKITGVAAGSEATDAVNVAQLTALGNQVDQNTTDITALDGRVTTVESTVNNINNGGGVKYFHTNSVQADSIASGNDSIAVGGNAKSAGTGAIAMGADSTASSANSVAIGQGAKSTASGSVALGQGSSDDGRGALTYTGAYSGVVNSTSGTISIGNAATGQTRTLTNVADGKEATDAVNLRQLDGAVAESKKYTDNSVRNVNTAVANMDGRVSTVEGDVTNIKNGADGMFQVNNGSTATKPVASGVGSTAGGAGAKASGANSTAIGNQAQSTAQNTVAVGSGSQATAKSSAAIGSNSIADRENSVSVGSSGNERQITNVAPGTKGTDAVNFDQLSKSVTNITNNANAYTDQRYSELRQDLKKQDDTLSAGIAGAMAMASLPQPYAPGASMTNVGVGNYRGQSAVAFGVAHISDNGRWVSKLQGSSDTQGQVGLALGVGYQW